jgi:GxxExxY protein
MDSEISNMLSVLFDPAKGSVEFPSPEMTEKVIGCAYKVANTLGNGFLERVYENSLAIELRKKGFKAIQQQKIEVVYEGEPVGYFEADIVVDDILIIEVKALRNLDEAHKAQCLNYLKATGLRLCLLMNFGTPRIEVKRVAL